MPDNHADDEPLAVPVNTAKRLSGLGHTTIYELIKQGKLKSTVVGRRRLINYALLKALVAPEAA
jgi:excisionase family DNA binding protein